MKKLFCLLAVLCLLAGCHAPAAQTVPVTTTAATELSALLPTQQATTEPLPQRIVGISLPEEASWHGAAEALQLSLSQEDCLTEIRYASQDPATQLTQLEELIAMQTECLIVVAIDSVVLAPALSQAKDAGIPVIAWDRMLMDAEGITCCISFDYAAIGAGMGQGLVRELSLDTAAQEQRSYTVEFFMGSAENPSALLLHKGLMEVLEPYLYSGVLVCRSGRTSFEDSCIQHGDPDAAKFQCNALIQRHYSEQLRPDVIVAGSDQLAHGCIQALTELGCTQENWPLITGQGTGTTGLRRVVSGKQILTMWCDEAPVIRQLADTVLSLLDGQSLPPSHTVNNHISDVPVLYTPASEIHRGNLEQLLVETGIYTLEELTE